MNNSRTKILAVGFVAGLSPFPEDKDLREGMFLLTPPLSVELLSISIVIGVILEGIPFFGDVLLRLPDITKEVREMIENLLVLAIIFLINNYLISSFQSDYRQ